MKKLSGEVAHELGRFGASAEMVGLVDVWPGVVGPTIARNAWPARLARDRTLHVATSSSSWAYELAQLEADVLRRLHDAGVKEPAKIRFAVGKLPELGPDDDAVRAERARIEPGPAELEQGAELAAGIDDDELRKLVAKAAAQSLLRAGSDR